MLENIVYFAPILGPIIAAMVAVFGWFIANRLNTVRDRKNKLHDMTTEYLINAYRRLEMAAHRENKTEEQTIAFESAVADIQLLGSSAQISTTINYVRAHASNGQGDINKVLCLLRNDLRKELGLSIVNQPPAIFRFTR